MMFIYCLVSTVVLLSQVGTYIFRPEVAGKQTHYNYIQVFDGGCEAKVKVLVAAMTVKTIIYLDGKSSRHCIRCRTQSKVSEKAKLSITKVEND
jgi:hypothetical protein